MEGEYIVNYTLDREQKQLVVEVKLHKHEGMHKPYQNIYYATAIANDKKIEHPDLAHCVNAQYMAEQIGEEIVAAWKIRAKKQGKSFRLKHKKDDNKRKKSNKKTVQTNQKGVQRRAKKMGNAKSG